MFHSRRGGCCKGEKATLENIQGRSLFVTCLISVHYSHLAPNHLTSAVNVLNSSMATNTKIIQNEKEELRNVA
jgi:hypothetical protein